jgi:predicted permease
MVTIREAVGRLISFFRKDQRDREFDQELAAHIEMATAEHIHDGFTPPEARRRALARLAGIEPAKQLHRETRGVPLLDGLIQDVRYSVRTFARSPVFTIASVGTLAIGIGATTAIFSTVNATLLRPLPYPAAEQLVDVHTRYVDGRVTTGLVATSEIVTLRKLPGVAGAAGVNYSVLDGTWISDDGTLTAVAMRPVTSGFFEVIGLPMAVGRAFNEEEHSGGPGVRTSAMVVSHRAWVQRFGSDPNIVGKSVRIGEYSAPLVVIGVGAPELDFPSGTDFWVNARYRDIDGSHTFNAIVRLRPGTTMAQLLSAGNLAMAELGKTVPQAVGREFLFQSLLSSLVGDLRPILLIVLGATALLLLLACVNVTNLSLAKGATQRHEIAMRTALGAGRGRVIRQLVTQSMVLSTAGTLIGLAFGYGAVRLLLMLGASGLPRLETVPFDWRVVLFSLVVLIVSGIGIGVVPALRLSDTDLKTVLNEHGRRTTSSHATSRAMSGMIVAEVAVAIALVAGAGWLIQSFARLRTIDPGFATNGRLLIDVRPTRLFSSPADATAWSTEMLNRVRGAAGDAPTGAAATFPMQADRDSTINVDFFTGAPDPNRVPSSRFRIVTPGFFEAMGTTVLAGRTFTEDDRTTTQPVAVINRAFAQKFVQVANPVGSAFAFGFPVPDRARPVLIVGVIDDIRYKAVSEEAEPTFYLPPTQIPFPLRRQWVVVSSPGRPAETLIPQIQNALKEFDPSLAATFTTSETVIDNTLKRQQLGVTLMLVFGATALALAAIGLYGVIAYAAAQRRGELATRIALGASGRQVFWLMMSGGQRLMAIGVVLGLFLAYAAGRIVSGSVFAMRAADPLVLLTAAMIVAMVAWIATMIPAVRASRQDPVRALRD